MTSSRPKCALNPENGHQHTYSIHNTYIMYYSLMIVVDIAFADTHKN